MNKEERAAIKQNKNITRKEKKRRLKELDRQTIKNLTNKAIAT